MKNNFIVLALLLIFCTIFGQTFTEIDAGLIGLDQSSMAWGDYDNDGDLDLLIIGDNPGSTQRNVCILYVNNGGTFEEVPTNLPGVSLGSVVWGDYDNDGDLDLFISGMSDTGPICKIFRNDSGEFTDIIAGLTGVYLSSADWGDFDNDGYLDLIVSGYYWDGAANEITTIYRNDGKGNFYDIDAGIMGLSKGTVKWGDYDNDGDLDILVTGEFTFNNMSYHRSLIYRNDNGVFTNINAGLIGLSSGSADWGDYDNDGDLDVIITGYYYDGGTYYHSKIYRNDDNDNFSLRNIELDGKRFSSALWGDYDNDGYLDIVIAGSSPSGVSTKIYHNNKDGTFSHIDFGISGVFFGDVSWVDYDNDGDLDLIITGNDGVNRVTKIYRNDTDVSNTPPSKPTNLKYSAFGTEDRFTWSKSNDNQTPSKGLSYNLYIGTVPLKGNIKSSMSDNETGYRKIVSKGNAGQNLSFVITSLSDGEYYWSVQAVDHSFAGSEFAPEQKFVKGALIEVETDLPDLSYSSASWGDYNNDGLLDILISGYTGSEIITRIYRNDGGDDFTDINAGLPGVVHGSVLWSDYNNDGFLDALITGNTGSGYISRIYRNNGDGSFTDIEAGLPGLYLSSIAMGDYNNDGYNDILIAGTKETGSRIAKIFKNHKSVKFIDIEEGFEYYDHQRAICSWVDFNNDGWLDLSIGSSRYVNLHGTDFLKAKVEPEKMSQGSISWGDYNNDGYPDYSHDGSIFRNDGNGFTHISYTSSGLPYLANGYSTSSWGDFDNDGLLDLLLTGWENGLPISELFRNNGNETFSNFNLGMPGIIYGQSVFADYDNDGKLDIFVTGMEYDYTNNLPLTKLYKNNFSDYPNIPPETPTVLNVVIPNQNNYGMATLKWDKATDAETPQKGLTYNVHLNYLGRKNYPVRTVLESMSDYSSGFRKVVGPGNSGYRNEITLYNLEPGYYSWKVQTIDHLYCGSEFSEEHLFYIGQSIYDFADHGIEDGNGYFSGWDFEKRYDNHFVEWADYNNDGLLDVLVGGHNFDESDNFTKLYRNEGGGFFTEINAGIPAVKNGAMKWGDYNNDGLPDILICGELYPGTEKITRIYKNFGNGVFEDIQAGIAGVSNASLAWGDYNNDGLSDILITGITNSNKVISTVYRNFGDGIFEYLNERLQGVISGSCAWGDYDNDGYLDIVLCGKEGFFDNNKTTKIYKNSGSGSFIDSGIVLPGVSAGSVAWGDYNNDGYLDLLLTGFHKRISSTEYHFIIKIFRNNGAGSFEETSFNFPSLALSSAIWGDIDNDGDLDVLISGVDEGSSSPSQPLPVTRIYINENYDNFSDFWFNYDPINCEMFSAALSFVDIDNDGALDISISGFYIDLNQSGFVTGDHRIKLYKNNPEKLNTVAVFPQNLTTSFNDSTITFSWDKSTDNETPQDGLSYNFYLGTESLKGNLKTSMSDNATGYRKVVELGNSQQNTSYTLNKALPNGKYYWSVQAVDHAFAGSEFAPEKSFVVLSSPQNVGMKHKDGVLKLFWDEVPGAERYYIYASDDPNGEFVNVTKQGTFNNLTWSQNMESPKKFYYVVAVIR